MCGRIRDPNVEEISEIKINPLRNYWKRERASYMRAGSDVPVVVLEDGSRALVGMKWGLLPSWSKSETLDYSTYNARSESIRETATFRGAWHRGQRCLFPTTGFYEKRRTDGKMFCFSLADSALMTFAGLWDEWRSPITGEIIRSTTIITTRPNELVGKIHNRMPVIIAPEDRARWLGEELATEDELLALLGPYPSDVMTVSPEISGQVGRASAKRSSDQLPLFG